MRPLSDWLEEYGVSHRHPLNEALHFICVPAIVLSILGLLWAIPVPRQLALGPWVNWATLTAALVLVYYLALSRELALGVLAVFVLMLLVVRGLAALPYPLWASCLAIFLVAWIGQFIGHAVEGRRPSFFKDVQFLLIGPIWLLAAAYRRIGWRY
jgi:uncharacterized membrane protein YGL010W